MRQGQDRQLPIFRYTDYRKYLADYYTWRKNGIGGYSYRMFSKQAGLSSPNFLKLVIDGERNLGEATIENFINALQIKGNMAEYFRALVHMNQSKDDTEKDKWLAVMMRLMPEQNRRELHAESHTYLSHWLYPVLREMVALAEFRPDPYWIAGRLHAQASVQDIAECWQFLVQEGFVVANAEGKWQSLDNMIVSSDEVGSLAVRNYHREMLGQAKDALGFVPMEQREFGALTFVLPQDALPELKKKLKEFRRELHLWSVQRAQLQNSEAVVQVNFQMYPHAGKKGSAP